MVHGEHSDGESGQSVRKLGFVAARFDPSEQWSYGLHRIEPFAAFLNGALPVPMIGVQRSSIGLHRPYQATSVRDTAVSDWSHAVSSSTS